AAEGPVLRVRVKPQSVRALERQLHVKTKRMAGDALARKLAKGRVDLRRHLDLRLLIGFRLLRLVALVLVLVFIGVRIFILRIIGSCCIRVALIVVRLEQSRDALFFIWRVERVRGDIFNVDRIGIQRPKEWLDVTLVIDPSAQPEVITARHEFAGHLAVRGRERLKLMKDAPIANRPRREDEDESEGQCSAGSNYVSDVSTEAGGWRLESWIFGLWSLDFDFLLRPKTKAQKPSVTNVTPTAPTNSPLSGRNRTFNPPSSPAKTHQSSDFHFFLFSFVSSVVEFRYASVTATNIAIIRKFVTTSVRIVAV